MVLQLLIDQEHHKGHYPRRQRMQQGDGHSRHAGQKPAHKREEVHDAHPDREHSPYGTPVSRRVTKTTIPAINEVARFPSM